MIRYAASAACSICVQIGIKIAGQRTGVARRRWNSATIFLRRSESATAILAGAKFDFRERQHCQIRQLDDADVEFATGDVMFDQRGAVLFVYLRHLPIRVRPIGCHTGETDAEARIFATRFDKNRSLVEPAA